MSRNYLFVVAHADDELLGCGATMQRLIAEGNDVYVCCTTHDAPTREANICQTMFETHKILGVKETFVGKATALELNKHERYELVAFIENAIKASECDVIFTHSLNDLNKDHVLTAELTLEAARLPQRLIADVKPIKEVAMFEVPCSTAWGTKAFEPNKYVEVSIEQLNKKIELIKMYDNVVRKRPHPRSEENIIALAMLRGCQGGFNYAEAYKTIFSTEI